MPAFTDSAAVPALIRTGGGSIVFVASQLGLAGGRNSVAYTAAKAGLINLARSMALDHAAANVRVNSICPGPVATPFLAAESGCRAAVAAAVEFCGGLDIVVHNAGGCRWTALSAMSCPSGAYSRA